MSPRPLLQTLRALTVSLPRRRNIQLALLLGLMLGGAVAEAVTLGTILPFLAILVDPQQALQIPLVARIISIIGLIATDNLRWQLTLIFVIAAVIAGVGRFVLVYATARLSFGIGHQLGAEIYRRTLYQPYEVHVVRNSSETIAGINKVDEVVGVVFGLLTMISALMMAAFIVVVLVLLNPVMAAIALIGLGGIYATVFMLARKKLAKSSQTIGLAYNRRVQAVQEGLGGIRDVLLDHAQPLFVRRFEETDWPLRQAQTSISVIGPSPRFAVEALGMVLIALFAYATSTSVGGLAGAIPALGALALGAQRLMPLVQQSYQGWVLVSGNRQLLQDVVDLLEQPIAEEALMRIERLRFDHEIRFEQVSFQYQPHLPQVLQEMNLTIEKGNRVGFVGTTGSGKSTLMDLLMGLLQPTDGQILVDGTPLVGVARLAWQHNIAHVPQTIYLADASFAENIAFGVPAEKIDLARVRQVAGNAQIAEFIEASPLGYQAMVGERGVRLSGGQRQRIGIARALYKRATVLVFDEATSALDGETESAVIASIQALGRDLTILMIAHRLSTLENCDMIFDLSQGHVTNIKAIAIGSHS